MALDRPRPPLPPTLPQQRPRLQGRFRSFPIQEGGHLLTILRYIERNPARAGLVARAQDWRWSSASLDRGSEPPPLGVGPVPRPAAWLGHVNAPQTEGEVAALRECIRRRPYGDEAWVERAARHLGLGGQPTAARPAAEEDR